MERRKGLKRTTRLVTKTVLHRKTPMPRGGSQLHRTPLAPVSPKRAVQLADYAVERVAYLKRHPWCAFPLGCGQRATTVQHLKGREGERLLDQRYWAPSCLPHNLWAEDHTGDALAIRWLLPINQVGTDDVGAG